MIKNVVTINKMGLSHIKCDDAIYIDEENQVFGVFDGVSNARFGGDGANALSKDIGRILADEKVKKHLACDSVKSIRNTMVKFINQSSENTAQSLNCSIEDLATTMIVASVYKDTVTIIHAGDGLAFSCPETVQNETPMIVSFMDNDNNQRVFPAQSKRQFERMRITRLKTSDIKCLVLCSDGYSDRFLKPEINGYYAYMMSETFKINSNEELEAYVEKNHLGRRAISDDISAIIIHFDNGIEYTDATSKQESIKGFDSDKETVPVTLDIKNDNSKRDNSNNGSSKVDEPSANKKSSKKVFQKAVKIVLALMLVVTLILTGIIGALKFNINELTRNTDKQISTLTQEVSSLNKRVDELEKSVKEKELLYQEEATVPSEEDGSQTNIDSEDNGGYDELQSQQQDDDTDGDTTTEVTTENYYNN